MERPDLTVHVFHIKMHQLLDDVTKNHVLGVCIGHLYMVEYQKRSLLHCHIVLIMDQCDHPKLLEEFDNIIQAAIPDRKQDPELYSLVTKHYLHGPCSPQYCSASGHCRFHFHLSIAMPHLFSNPAELSGKGPTMVENVLKAHRMILFI